MRAIIVIKIKAANATTIITKAIIGTRAIIIIKAMSISKS